MTSPEPVKITYRFRTTQDRDEFMDREYPECKAMETPGHYQLPDGREMFVFMDKVTVVEVESDG